MIRPQLFSKELGLAIRDVAKIGEFKVPKKAVTFDRVTGTGKKGDFEIITFKNARGKIIKRGTSYLDESGNSTHIIKNFGRTNHNLRINESIYRNGVEDSFTSTLLTPLVKKDEPKKLWGFLRRQQKLTKQGDVAAEDFLQAGKKPKGLEWDCNYDGSPTEIRYKNIGTKLDITEGEAKYLPVVLSDLTTKNVEQRLSFLQMLQEKKFGLEGLLPKVKLVKLKELNPNMQKTVLSDNMLAGGDATWHTGQVRIADIFKKTTQILANFFGHEYKHIDDFVKILRLYEPEVLEQMSKMKPEEVKALYEHMEKLYPGAKVFEDKCVAAKGYIMPSDKEWQFFKDLQSSLFTYKYASKAEHDALPLEVRAIEAGDMEEKLFANLIAKLNQNTVHG